MNEVKDVTEYVPILIGFCTGLTILGGIIITMTSVAVKKYLHTTEEKDKLKEQNIKATIRNCVQDSHSELRLLIEKQHGDFKLLEAGVNNAVNQMKAVAFDMKPKKTYLNGNKRANSA